VTDASGAPLLEARGLSRSFPGVRALHAVDLALHCGEVLAVIGENGAGKSTLMKCLAGVQQPDAGEVRLDGRPVRFDSVRSALAHGIALIHQELNLADNLDVAANLFLGREPRRLGLLDRARMAQDARALLARVGLRCAPDTLVRDLSIGSQQLVEIAKALSVEARVLIMDEPTSSLSVAEAEILFRVIGELRATGVSVIYISHRLGEVSRIADRVVVLRDGENAGELARAQIEHDAMVRLMVGRDVARFYARAAHAVGAPLLEVRDLIVPEHPRERVSFALRAGEIVGLAGLVGAGRSELLETLFCVRRRLGGEVLLAGRPLAARAPRAAIAAGLVLVPEDRKRQGLVLGLSVADNLGLAALRADRARLGFVDRRRQRALVDEQMRRLRVKAAGPRQPVQLLSGGNQQKVVLGKVLALRPRVLLLDEPTRGIDVGAKQEIHELIEALAAEGVAILFASSEMTEIIGLADRVLVLHEGALRGELARTELSEEAILQLATGAKVRAS
jgi:ribose transport system ATP-binding protein